uniref:receptor-type tyrosine-protein phosphatase kappa isoform X2 n=1 Tax=Ciona intestinalis TaxID=7719 RepID=UPI00089DCF1C|nr:receptor-type tyrosine-protein phosphatase kappa isoform X2 [Ciona intestinalis]|eukprot:XP_018671516.1 receptor-type tyrosine-protein phosphatase kappa isoform X2 [Ciona intestinalis]
MIMDVTVVLLLLHLASMTRGLPAYGSCNFDEADYSCGYTQEVDDNFDWLKQNNVDGGYFMEVETENHIRNQKAVFTSPQIVQQDTHCFSFKYHLEGSGVVTDGNGSSPLGTLPTASGRLSVYVRNDNTDTLLQPVWTTPELGGTDGWATVHLALNPLAYRVSFEATVLQDIPGVIAVDNIVVSSKPCDSTPHFLRLGNKDVNKGQNVSLKCLLWGHSGPDQVILMQKSSGETITRSTRKVLDDHLSVTFNFTNVDLHESGKYRCISQEATKVGVSNYAQLSVRKPPRPTRGPMVSEPGSTSFMIQLNIDEFTGDGPIVQTILKYRPVDGLWADVHHITNEDYQLWHLQPDTEYEVSVTLVRPGVGGAGPPGPTLRRKTKCGVPLQALQNVIPTPVGSNEIQVTWNVPDFSIVQCHFYQFVVKYRIYDENEPQEGANEYLQLEVQQTPSASILDLRTFTRYAIKVSLVTSGGSIDTGDYIMRTGEGAPSEVPPQSFVTTFINETSIALKWAEPTPPNGEIIGYEVSYRGTRSFDPTFQAQNDNGLIQEGGDKRGLVLTGLHPGTRFAISIRAHTKAGVSNGTEIIASTDISAPTMPRYPNPFDSSNKTITPTTIEITLKPADANGAPITNYYIIIEDVTPKPKTPSKPAAPSSVRNKKNSGKGNKRKRKNRNRNTRSLDALWRHKRQAVVAVSDEPNACLSQPITFEEAQRTNRSSYAGARFAPSEVTQDMKFMVGGSSDTNGFTNPPLDPNKDYKIYVRAESNVGGEVKANCVLVALKDHKIVTPTTRPTQPTMENTKTVQQDNGSTAIATPGDRDASQQEQVMLYAAVGGAVVAVLVISIVVILLAIKFKRRRKRLHKDEVVNPFEVRMMISDVSTPGHTLLPTNHGEGSVERRALMPDVVGYEHQDYIEKASENGASYPPAPSSDERFAVRVDDFHVHVSQMKATGGYGFREEFSTFVDGPAAPWTVAEKPQNRIKNRYGNIMAYDHSRVVLEPLPGHEEEYGSDYINASYVNGYKKPGMYIATQAPTSDTSADFWLMVWQERSNIIVMVTNLVELGKRKCHQYWPDETGVYGSIQVSMNNVEETSDYVVRSFVVQQTDGYDVREGKQFHFTSWPDHGVPSRPTNLLSFVRRVKSYDPQGEGPTLVHCSAGSGRTGCFMVIDMMLDMARDEDIVDIHNTVKEVRTRRVNMVQTEEQYIFIHEAVLEALLCGETSVPAGDLVQHYDELITVDPQTHFAPIQEEFETLNVITPKLSEDECSVARLPRNRGANRFMDVLPADRHLAYLVTPDPADRENNYINAVYVDSYSSKNEFLVTQMPLPNTVIDIWRLIYDHNCSSIVMMNDVTEHDQTCRQYWPDQGSAIYGSFTVELLTKDDEVDVVTRLFKLQNIARPGDGYRLVQQFQLTNWPAPQPVPYSRNSVLRIIQLISKWQSECSVNHEPGRALVHCVAGAGRSGSFIACYNMCEQLRNEYSVDVFNIVQRLRNVRPQLVETLEQYRFCYEVGIEFADQ